MLLKTNPPKQTKRFESQCGPAFLSSLMSSSARSATGYQCGSQGPAMRLTKVSPLCWAEYWDWGQGPNVFPSHILLEDLIHTVTTQGEIKRYRLSFCAAAWPVLGSQGS